MNSVYMKDITWREFEERKSKPVILPVGSTEQHSFHLPFCTDSAIAEGISARLAEKIDGTVMPTVCYGYKSKPMSGGGPLFPGTIDLSGRTLISLAEDILEELCLDGVKLIFVNNAHFENEAFLLEAIDIVSKRHSEVTILESNWWDVLPQSVIDKVFEDILFPGWALEHAAVTETSLMMYLAPELVNMDMIPTETDFEAVPYHKYPIVKGMVPESGALASAKGSSAEKGKFIADTAVEEFVKIIDKYMA
ncbi:MAG: creatininase [Oscillospiraceae bacterium]